MFPLTQSLGTVPFSSIILNSFLYIGINMCLVEVMYSFSIPSVPLDLFAFKDFIAVLISPSLIGLSSDACDS